MNGSSMVDGDIINNIFNEIYQHWQKKINLYNQNCTTATH